MNKEIIYSMNTAYRGEYEIQGFSYGSGDKAACIVGAMRGNEFQQLYISSLLAKKLGELEARGALVSGKKILLIPSINYSSFNVGKKYWITDNSDINRSFPGNPEGQATSRIAAAVMEKVTGYAYGIQFASFYMDGEFIPHVRMIETGKQSNSLASQFGSLILDGERNVHFELFASGVAHDLILKAGNELTAAELENEALSLAAIKSNAIFEALEVDDGGIALLDLAVDGNEAGLTLGHLVQALLDVVRRDLDLALPETVVQWIARESSVSRHHQHRHSEHFEQRAYLTRQRCCASVKGIACFGVHQYARAEIFYHELHVPDKREVAGSSPVTPTIE